MKICVVTDNDYLYREFKKILKQKNLSTYDFDFYYTEGNVDFDLKHGNDSLLLPIMLKKKSDGFYKRYDMFMSLHSKQIFPCELVNNYRCVNVHPGYNPYNRGWYPQVFSIINKLPVGVTIHEMDGEIDHGPIIYQEQVCVNEYDTSLEVYKKIQKLEVKMLEKYLENILENKYTTFTPQVEGNMNTKKDFMDLCQIHLDEKISYRDVLDHLRALSFGEYNNAYYYDNDGRKVFVKCILEKSADILPGGVLRTS